MTVLHFVYIIICEIYKTSAEDVTFNVTYILCDKGQDWQRDHLFRTCTNVSEKLTFLTPLCVSEGKKCKFSENCVYVINEYQTGDVTFDVRYSEIREK